MKKRKARYKKYNKNRNYWTVKKKETDSKSEGEKEEEDIADEEMYLLASLFSAPYFVLMQ